MRKDAVTRIGRIALCVGVLVMSDACLLVGSSDVTQYLDGRSNGEFPGFLACVACLVFGVALALIACVPIGLRMYRGRWRERLMWLLLLAGLVAPWLFLSSKMGYVRAEDGFAEWAAAVNPAPIRAWAASTPAPTSAVSAAPVWWALKTQEAPFGVAASPGAARALVEGPLPDEVRILPTSGNVILSWGFTGTFPRYLLIGAPGSLPPPEFEPEMVTWRQIKPGVWIGCQQTH